MLLAAMAVCTFAAAPTGSGTYYSPANGKKGSALKTALCGIIYNRTEKSYDYLWTAFQTTDKRSDGKVWDMYSNITNFTFGTDQAGNYQKEGDVYNREHSFPKSWFGGSVMPMYSDLHHMYPTDGYVNNQRGNLPFGEVSNPTYSSSGGFSKVGPCSYSDYTGKVFEPADAYKGDFARTYFYMVTCYEEKLADWYSKNSESRATIDGTKYPAFQSWQLNMLMEWATNDPVSEKEINRNNAVAGIQGNRNPFIDYPGLEQYIWGNKTDVAFSYDNYEGGSSGSGEGGGGDDPDPDPNPGSAGTYKLQQVTSVEEGGLYVFEQGGYVMSNECSSSALQTTNSYNTTGLSGTETYVWTLESATGGFYMKNVSLTNYPYLYNTTSKTNVSFGNSGSSVWAFKFQDDNTVLIQNKSNSDRFLGYTSSTSYAYKAYATSNLSSYPHAIKVYQLVEETPSPASSDLALTGAPVALSFDLYNNSSAQTVSYTTSGTGAVTVSGGEGYVETSVDPSTKTITVTPMAVTPSVQTITVSQAADATHEAGSVTFTVSVSDSTPASSPSSWGWVQTDITELTASDVFVIVGTNSSGSFAMGNESGSAPAAIPVTIADGKITSPVADNIKWNISSTKTNSGGTLYTFYPNGSTTTWLYCNNDDNGLRVGTTTQSNTFKIVDNYIYNTKQSRYIGIYNSQDWRCYSTIHENIQNQTFAFYKYVLPPFQAVAVGDTGYATMVAEADLEIPSGVEAYAVQVNVSNSFANLVPITTAIPAGEPVVVKASEGIYNFVYASERADDVAANDLKAATTDVTSDGTQYCLADFTFGPGFYQVASGIVIPAGKAYLVIPADGSGSVKLFYGFEEEDATGIGLTPDTSLRCVEDFYDLSGRKMGKGRLPKGIYIVNGKKYLK